jgi:hypothetical protein
MYREQTVDDPENFLTPESTLSSEFRTHSNPQNQIYRNLSSPSPLSCFLRQNSLELRRRLSALATLIWSLKREPTSDLISSSSTHVRTSSPSTKSNRLKQRRKNKNSTSIWFVFWYGIILLWVWGHSISDITQKNIFKNGYLTLLRSNYILLWVWGFPLSNKNVNLMVNTEKLSIREQFKIA